MEGLKRCFVCREWLSFDSFCKDKNRSDGLQPRCRLCCAECYSRYYKKNRDKMLMRLREYQANNKDKRHAYYQNNKDAAIIYVAKRKAVKLNQTPLDANLQKIQFYYTVCNETNDILGGTFFHVDHIQPLSKGGLHHEDNLQILEASLNLSKGVKWPLSEEDILKYRGIIL